MSDPVRCGYRVELPLSGQFNAFTHLNLILDDLLHAGQFVGK